MEAGAKEEVPVAYDLSVVKSLDDLSGMFQHWATLKGEHPDKILLYRVGDFYECYFGDAVTLANVCNFAVTSKLCGTKVGYKAAMSGLPMHSVEKHIPKLLQEGYVVAVVEQLEEAGTPGIGNRNLERGVVDILTPGTVTDAGHMPGSAADGGRTRGNNYLAAVMPGTALAPGHAGRWGLAFADVSTGEVFCTDCHEGGNASLAEELQRLQPAEVLVPANFRHQGRGDLVGGGRGNAAETRAMSFADAIYNDAALGVGGAKAAAGEQGAGPRDKRWQGGRGRHTGQPSRLFCVGRAVAGRRARVSRGRVRARRSRAGIRRERVRTGEVAGQPGYRQHWGDSRGSQPAPRPQLHPASDVELRKEGTV